RTSPGGAPDRGPAAGPGPGGTSSSSRSSSGHLTGGPRGSRVTPMPAIEHFWAVVPAGGSGTRLWPLSRSGSPKFLHDLTGSGRSLLQETADRLEPLAGDRLLVVTGARHRDRVVEQLPEIPADRVFGEPSPRDSMAAIGL